MKIAFLQCDEEGNKLKDDLIFILMDLKTARQTAEAMLAGIKLSEEENKQQMRVGFPIEGKIEEYSKYADKTSND